MATGSENYLSLVRQAFNGDLKLPAFQRAFKWNRKQVIRLYDSIRLSYPVGSIIVLEGTKQELKERSFRGSNADAEQRTPKRLVLDGQQRLTAGIDLFYGETEESISQYFIDIQKLFELLELKKVDIDSEVDVSSFLMNLEDDDGYCVARSRVANPFQLLEGKHLLSTVLLRPDNSRNRDHYLESYESKYPHFKSVVRNVIKPYLVINEAPDIPFVSIDSSLQMDSISRIFSTLNSTGKVLTPFELVVAVLFSSGIDLREDLKLIKELYPMIKYMDDTGEICLQTVVMLSGGDFKKASLPKALTASAWQAHQQEAADLLSKVGQFLTEHFGMALDGTNQLIPYDSIFMPMASVMKRIGYGDAPVAVRASANKKMIEWVVGSALSQRYQEGVHTKQARDAEDMAVWISKDSDEYKPGWLSDVSIPSLRLIGTKGAIANLLRCILNQDSLKDPLTGDVVNFGKPKVHAHHIFPTKFVEKMPGWNAQAGDKSDIFLNLMQLSSDTNGRFLNDDPAIQVADALKNKVETQLIEIFERQGVPSEAFALLKKTPKTKDDYVNFLKIRETFFENRLAQYGFLKVSGAEVFDELEAG